MRQNTSDKLVHNPTGRGHGKWENINTLRKYLNKRNRRNKMASESRRRNRK